MKRINCFIPYGKIEATRQTVAQLAESSLVSQIYLITDDPHAKAIYPCNLIRTENIWSTKTLREIAGYASAHYTLIYTDKGGGWSYASASGDRLPERKS